MRSGKPPEPRPAATVVVLREVPGGLEVLLTVRPRALRFMGGATVFPGGALAPADLDPAWEQHSVLSAAQAAAALGLDDERVALGLYVCALRECYEEVGLFAAAGPAGRPERHAAATPEGFLAEVVRLGLELRTDLLVPAGRWVTPLGAPMRFDARFFLLAAPDGFEPEPDPDEVAGCAWLGPGAALAELAAGQRTMAPPTVEMLQRLAGHSGIGEAIAALSARAVGGERILTARLSPLVQVVVAPNPGLMTGPGTNTYLVGGPPAIVVDPAVDDPDYLAAIERLAGGVAAIVVTHRHPDHTGGVSALAARAGAEVLAFGAAPAGGHAVEPLADGDVIERAGVRLVALHTPGHSSDHLCLLLDGAASLFSGDAILGEGTAVIAPPDGDMGAYLDSLARLATLELDRIYPGHFRPLDGGRAVIEGYLAHRAERERAIVQALRDGAVTVEDIVERVYRDTPDVLHPVAAYSVRAHLELLARQGRARAQGGRWQLDGDG